jgi:YebC/PmpR family DNA-binding regulatory protein
MSGHSKWSQIKRQKGVADVKRGAAFTKAGRAITIAAKQSGTNPETNFKLRLAIDAARQINMPKENIERATAKGSGTKDGISLEEITYEGFGPAGVAIMVETVTDSRSRTTQEVRSVFERSGGRLSSPGSVAHIFSQIGEISIKLKEGAGDEVLLVAADSGADDIDLSADSAIVYCNPAKIEDVKKALLEAGLEIIEAGISRKPSSTINISDEATANSIISLMNKLEDLDDVQKVYANFDIPDEIINKSF